MTQAAIKSMKLYSQVDRIYSDLANLGIKDDEPLTVELLSPFDHFHYFGAEAVNDAISLTGIAAHSRVLDIGSGLGGPARYMAQQTGCNVTAVELQPDMNSVAASLTARCGLADRIDHICGDVLATPLEDAAYHAAVSWLAIYHITDRSTLFGRVHRALKPGGRVCFEDLYGLGKFSSADQVLLETMLYGRCLPDRDTYVADLAGAGFTGIEFRDMTQSWQDFTVNRLSAYRAARNDHIAVHGSEVVDALDAFYASVVRLFESGNLGGVRLTATAG